MRQWNVILVLLVAATLVEMTFGQERQLPRRARLRVPVTESEEEASSEEEQRPIGRRLRVRVRPQLQEEEQVPQVQYYAAIPATEANPQTEPGLVLVQGVTNDALYNGLYGRQIIREDAEPVRYRPAVTRTSAAARASPAVRKEKPPPVQTIRNYNKVNDDGSFTFGYEAADGSFKEETRGTDCVVRGKYGYVDPDGNKREFTYVSGNPCDPNAVEEEEESSEEVLSDENIPLRPIRPLRPRPNFAQPNRATTRFQQSFEEVRPTHQLVDSDEDEEEQQLAVTPTATPTPVAFLRTRPTASAEQVVRITPRPVRPVQRRPPVQYVVTQPPATTYRPALRPQFVSTTARPPLQQFLYTNSNAGTQKTLQPQPFLRPLRPTASPSPQTSVDFNQELKKFQLENNVVSTPRPAVKVVPQGRAVAKAQPQVVSTTGGALAQAPRAGPNGPVYTSQLVYDPSTGQYNTLLYQQLPKTGTEINLNHRLQAFVQPQSTRQIFPHLQQQSQQPQPQQQLHHLPPQLQQYQQPLQQAYPGQQQQYYFVTPNQRTGLASGQIDAFLKGHNLQF